MRSNIVDLRRDRREYTMETLLLKAIFFEHDGYVKGSRESCTKCQLESVATKMM